jgi:hypothetical protein
MLLVKYLLFLSLFTVCIIICIVNIQGNLHFFSKVWGPRKIQKRKENMLILVICCQYNRMVQTKADHGRVRLG